MGEQRWRLGPTSIPSELGHLAVPIKFFAQKKKNTWPTRVSNPGPLGPELYPAFAPHWLDKILSRKSRLISRTKIDGTIEFDLCGIYCILILLVDWKLMLSSLHRTASRYSFLFWNLKIIISEFTDAFRTRHQHRFITHWRELRGKYSRMRFEKCSLLNRTVISEVVLALLSVAHRTLECRKFQRKNLQWQIINFCNYLPFRFFIIHIFSSRVSTRPLTLDFSATYLSIVPISDE